MSDPDPGPQPAPSSSTASVNHTGPADHIRDDDDNTNSTTSPPLISARFLAYTAQLDHEQALRETVLGVNKKVTSLAKKM